MASRIFDCLQVLGKGIKVVHGSFGPDTANAPGLVLGKGFTVARTSTGLFTITLTDSYVSLISADCSLQLASADDKYVQFGAIDVKTAKTVQIRVMDVSGAAVADVAKDANNRIHFTLLLKNSSVT
jgi:hypothetical protein